ncbi:tldc domain-containing protein [Stylonychia lemnae]|uniref:Tldc domain-containing protein n=1 Tax=Stylonychia lemnae TaxID=5949 RepID=A0A077ZWI2_STYLE|nr:tldc domain-containing protein [Stylonychia lemnae]|eukprot:CDW74229.1 tldc domain-containing protein [Stylonychia lemnae]
MENIFSLKIRESFDRYRIENRIGSGAFGSVYVATDLQDPNKNELSTSDLAAVVKQRKQLTGKEIINVMIQLLEGLDYIHKKGFIHRDISPQNILVFEQDLVKICDFGVASYGLQTVMKAGKNQYMAPESMMGGLQYDKNVDIWSLGILLFYLCAGSENIDGVTVNSILAVKREQVLLPQGYNQFQDIFNSMTAYNPQQRPSIQQLKADFIRMIDKASDHQKLQNLVLSNQLNSLKDDLHVCQDELSQCLSFNLNQYQQYSKKAIKQHLQEFDEKLKLYQEEVSSYCEQLTEVENPEDTPTNYYNNKNQCITSQQSKKLDLQIDLIQIQTTLDDFTAQKLDQRSKGYYKEFRRLVNPYVSQNNQTDVNLFKLKGKCQLLYRATKDGFKAADFHYRCDNKGPSISFILSEHGQVFGGYSSISWQSPEDSKYHIDKEALIFQLSKNTLHQQHRHFENAVRHCKDYLMVFGKTNDIQILPDCNKNDNSRSNLGSTYMLPSGLTWGEWAKEYLAGSYHFKVIEIEVYQVIKHQQ